MRPGAPGHLPPGVEISGDGAPSDRDALVYKIHALTESRAQATRLDVLAAHVRRGNLGPQEATAEAIAELAGLVRRHTSMLAIDVAREHAALERVEREPAAPAPAAPAPTTAAPATEAPSWWARLWARRR